MLLSFRRRRTVALAFVLLALAPVILIGVQPTASAPKVQPAASLAGPDTPNPTIRTAYGEKVVVTASPKGLDFRLSGFKQGSRTTFITVIGLYTGVNRSIVLNWKRPTYNYFLPLSKPDNYSGQVALGNPNGGWGAEGSYRLVVPQVGTSKLMITSGSLPPAEVGVRYQFRFAARDGGPPYNWILVTGQFSGLPKGLHFISTGPEAGTIYGVPQVTGSFWVPVIVRDKFGHSAFTLLNQLQVT